MSSDPKKPPFDAPPQGTPDLLQRPMSLDRRTRVPTFDELTAEQKANATTDPMQQKALPARPQPRPDEQPTQALQKAAVPPGLQPRQPGRAAPPTPAEMWSVQQQGRPSPAEPWSQGGATQPVRAAASRAPAPPPSAGVPSRPAAPARAGPPSPVEYALARPGGAMPQVTPSVPSQGGVVPEGQLSTPNRAHPALKPAAPQRPAPFAEDFEARTIPVPAAARPLAPQPAAPPVRRPAALPAEMMVTQPGLPGPFAQARAMPQSPAVPQRSSSVPEVPQVSPEPAPALAEPQFDEPRLSEPDTVTAEPAALWRRVGAWLTDLLFVGVLVLLFLTIAVTVIAPRGLSPLQQLTAIAIPGAALAAVLAFVYTALFAFLWNGRTPGRRVMGIHLVDTSGHAPAPLRALVRAMLSLVSFGLFLSGFWLALFDRHGQTLHDKLTRTFVVKLQDA